MKQWSFEKLKIVKKIYFLYLFVLGLCQTNILGGCVFCKRRKDKNLLNNIKSKYIFSKILNNTTNTTKFKIIRYNNQTQNRLKLSIIDYMDVCIFKNYRYNLEITFSNKGIVKERNNKKCNKESINKMHWKGNWNNKIEFERKEEIDIECILKKIIDILKGRYHVQKKDNTNGNNNNIEKDPLYKIDGKSILTYDVKENNNTFTISLNSLIGGKIIQEKNSKPEIKNDWSELKAIINVLKSYKLKIEIGLKLTSKHNLFTSCERMFEYFSNCTKIDLSEFYTGNVTNMSYMFRGCFKLKELNLNNINTSNVIDMSYMFYGCSSLTNLDLNNFNTSNVTDMSYMFHGCSSLNELNFSNFNTSNVTDMCGMFKGCSSLKELNINNFNTRNVTNMSYMFCGCTLLKKLNINNINTSNTTNMCYMFFGCLSIKNLNLENFDTKNVTNMGNMFFRCSNLKELNINNFNTSKVTDMSYMFCDCEKLRDLNFGESFNTGNVKNMSHMFRECSSLEKLNLDNFNTSNVTDMSYMFCGCKKLIDLNFEESFDTSNVKNMSYMFENCKNLRTLKLSEKFNTESAKLTDIFRYCDKKLKLIIINHNIDQEYNIEKLLNEFGK